MSDANPVVAALEEFVRHMETHGGQPGSPNDNRLQQARAALPIARAMAERERELVAALEDVLAHTSNRGCLCSTNDRLIRAVLDRAHAAGVEVTGHE